MQSKCPNCQGTVDFKPELLGQTIQCPHCQNQITVNDLPAKSKSLSKVKSILAILLFAVGVLQVLYGFTITICWKYYEGFYNSIYFKLFELYRLYLIIPVIGCILSIFYFITVFLDGKTSQRKIHWEYLGIVLSGSALIQNLFNLAVFLSHLIFKFYKAM